MKSSLDESLHDQNQSSSSLNVPRTVKQDGTSATATATKLFECTMCTYTCRHKANFDRHQHIHESSNTKRFKCKHCAAPSDKKPISKSINKCMKDNNRWASFKISTMDFINVHIVINNSQNGTVSVYICQNHIKIISV